MNCTPTQTHAHTRTVGLEYEGDISTISASGVWDNSLLSARCSLSLRLALRPAYITEALKKSIHDSLCRHHNGRLYILGSREFLWYNIFDSWTREGMQRRRRKSGVEKKRDYKRRDLFFHVLLSGLLSNADISVVLRF